MDEIKDGSNKAYIDQQDGLVYSASLAAANLYSDGLVLGSNSGSSAFTNTTTETSLMTTPFSIPAGTLRDGDTIEFFSRFSQTNNSGANNNFTYRIKLNGSAVSGWSPAYTQATNAFGPEGTMKFTGIRMSSTTIHWQAEIIASNPLNTTIGFRIQPPGSISYIATVSNLDSNALTLDFTGQFSVANANINMTPRHIFGKVTRK